MIRTQRWIPDTCANEATGDVCVFLETWDDSVPDIGRTHSFKTREKVCSRHGSLPEQACYAANYEENRRKNVAIGIAKTTRPTMDEKQVRWSFRADGTLDLVIGTDFTAQQRNQVRSAVDLQFGPGKVVLG